ncbi:MAG TPA: RNA-binding protein [Polyangia bacterium]|nr:RNA-binding protein [Polyangia bacterium]
MGTKLYVGNLSYNTTEETLRTAFEADGRQVREVAIITDRMTGQPRGFAFVEMGSPADAQAAIAALDGRELDGRTLRVSEARERSGGGGGGGGGGRGGYGDRGGGGRGRR